MGPLFEDEVLVAVLCGDVVVPDGDAVDVVGAALVVGALVVGAVDVVESAVVVLAVVGLADVVDEDVVGDAAAVPGMAATRRAVASASTVADDRVRKRSVVGGSCFICGDSERERGR